MTVKERIIEKIEGLDEARLLELERTLDALVVEREGAKSPQRAEEIQRRIAAWNSIAGLLSDPDDYAAFEREARRRPLSGGVR